MASYNVGRWNGTAATFMSQASHYVDLLDWLIDQVGNIYAYTVTLG